jgi:hypothetical protein
LRRDRTVENRRSNCAHDRANEIGDDVVAPVDRTASERDMTKNAVRYDETSRSALAVTRDWAVVVIVVIVGA